MSGLPKILAEIEAIAGTAVALKVASEFGGTRINLSSAEGSALVEAVGKDEAEKIVRALGQGRQDIPMADLRGQRGRRALAARMFANGATVREVALACDIHERTAWRVKSGPKDDPEAPTLFDRD